VSEVNNVSGDDNVSASVPGIDNISREDNMSVCLMDNVSGEDNVSVSVSEIDNILRGDNVSVCLSVVMGDTEQRQGVQASAGQGDGQPGVAADGRGENNGPGRVHGLLVVTGKKRGRPKKGIVPDGLVQSLNHVIGSNKECQA
jgi:hypothetical protein